MLFPVLRSSVTKTLLGNIRCASLNKTQLPYIVVGHAQFFQTLPHDSESNQHLFLSWSSGEKCPKLFIITDYLETYLTSFLCPSYRSKDWARHTKSFPLPCVKGLIFSVFFMCIRMNWVWMLLELSFERYPEIPLFTQLCLVLLKLPHMAIWCVHSTVWNWTFCKRTPTSCHLC